MKLIRDGKVQNLPIPFTFNVAEGESITWTLERDDGRREDCVCDEAGPWYIYKDAEWGICCSNFPILGEDHPSWRNWVELHGRPNLMQP